ncbi:helix-turn-helix domain containing protein [Mycobacteroides abscessus subsp. abscessus]|uniref:helix-turn-helix domain containing protein n=1 Tax=Mycobacteroides abscessus TaxID=36809 RepID=UPI00092958A1|nr:helix-turn-helix domain containing protein [Mycobacteroides abscessus]MBN7402844.1 helix-turn-helix domain containing protein [Mycobacteroides abscessus subsp. abscessus]MDO3088881.1 helix-turn-helix domain containing protein [Mycobacteroides abscessus subsp. abscessus]MDO3270654.1 helix-turn-helix domain containing protein [Mycobacteroides abscessus subsp. abscessus]SHQ37637.1 Uncharacterised protein [Mycobacteroides abscessus subsp. abscessus]SHY83362.1 Uncharacterised protein [Mycobacter
MSEVAAVVEEHEVEVLTSVTLDEAEEMAAEIRRLAAVARDGFEQLALAVERAKTTNICQVLGYRSWPEFIEAQFGGKIEVHGSARQEVMAFLAGEGMSVRSIAAITDSSKSTVSRVLNQVSQSGTAESDDAVVADEDQVSQNGTGESEVAQAVPEEKFTHGRDDKKYRKPKPRKKPDPKPEPKPVDERPAEVDDAPKRKVQIQSAVRAITKSLGAPVRELVELTYDPRWPKAVPRLTRDDAMDILHKASQLSLVAEAITAALDEQSGQSSVEPRPGSGPTEPTLTVEADEVTTTSGPVEPEVVQQEPETPRRARPTNCGRCNVDLPASATSPICDDCDGAPESTAPAATEPPAVVVHNEAISKRNHERRRFGARKVSA